MTSSFKEKVSWLVKFLDIWKKTKMMETVIVQFCQPCPLRGGGTDGGSGVLGVGGRRQGR